MVFNRLIVISSLLFIMFLIPAHAMGICGDFICDVGEDPFSCPIDCGAVGNICGNAVCEAGEDAASCPQDCVVAAVCGDATCDAGEDANSCPADCSICGDSQCTGNENINTCAQDCSVCGDNQCTGSENVNTCAQDCSVCGDNQCTGSENINTCAQDCSVCGDNQCTGSENVNTCAQDCSVCGDGLIHNPNSNNQQEQCDDGNLINRDGCSAICQIEDITPPGITINQPLNGTTFHNTDVSLTVQTNETATCTYSLTQCQPGGIQNLMNQVCPRTIPQQLDAARGGAHTARLQNLTDTNGIPYQVHVSCLDASNNSNSAINLFNINTSLNRAPVIDFISGSRNILETQEVTLAVAATDANLDATSFFINDTRFRLAKGSIYLWNTTLNDSGIYDIEIGVTDGHKNTTNTTRITVRNAPDTDNDGIADFRQDLIGIATHINSSTIRPYVEINSSSNLEKNYKGDRLIQIGNGRDLLVEFPFTFGKRKLYLNKLRIEKENATDSAGSFLMSGLDLPENVTKTIYINNVNNVTTLCLKDANVTSISQISSLCNGPDEYGISCPGTANNGKYNCSVLTIPNNLVIGTPVQLQTNRTIFKITGLTHSAAIQSGYCGDGVVGTGETCSNCPTDVGACPVEETTTSSGSGGGGGGGGGSGGGIFFTCNQKWQCSSWTECDGKWSTRECDLVKVPQHTSSGDCPSLDDIPNMARECSIEETQEGSASEDVEAAKENQEEITNSTATEEDEASAITGRVVEETGNGANKWIAIALLALIILGILRYVKNQKNDDGTSETVTEESAETEPTEKQ